MSKYILNKNNCIFKCPALAGTVSVNQPKTFNDGSGNALTQKAALSGNGTCSILTSAASGVPQNCTLKNSTAWTAGIEMSKKINGQCLLNQNAKMLCPVGSMISVSMLAAGVGGIGGGTAASAAVSENSGNAAPEPESGKEKKSADNRDKQQEQSSDKQDKQEEQSADKQEKQEEQSADNRDKQEEQSAENQEEEKSEKKKTENIIGKYAICSYGSCGKAEECPYFNAEYSIDTEGAARKLRDNSPSKQKAYDDACDRIMEENKVSWGNQAHHMISANAAYCKNPELVKLGNYFGYDINCEENCAFLPAWQRNDGYGEKNTHYKKAQSYEVMRLSGRQWHVGQHHYIVSLPENIREKYPELRTLECYDDRINADVKRILGLCKKRFGGRCLEKHFEIYKNWFFGQMNGLSEEVETHLKLFKKYAKESRPYFVSLESIRFAYELPRSGKVILVSQDGGRWKYERFQYTNYIKNANAELIPQGSTVYTESELKQLIIFCENVRCFLIADDTMTYKLPFREYVFSKYIKTEDKEKKTAHFSAMMAENAESEEGEYAMPMRIINRRLKECGLL